MAEEKRAARVLTETEIKDEARVTPDDIERARQWWKKNVPGDVRDLLEAVPSTDDEVVL